MCYFHCQTNISPAFINSVAECIKIAGISVRMQYALGEKYYDNQEESRRIKAFLGHDREGKTASQDSSMTPQRAAHLQRSSTYRKKKQKNKITVHLKRNKWQDRKEQYLSASHCVQHIKEQILHPSHSLSSSKHGSSIVALWSPCHVGQAKTNVMSVQ